MKNINYIENLGSYFPGMSAEVASIIGDSFDSDVYPAYVTETLIINDDIFRAYALCRGIENDVVEVKNLQNTGGIIRLPNNVFRKYFHPFEPETMKEL